MAGRFTVDAIFRAVDRITAPVRRMQNSIARMGRQTERSLRSINRSFSKVNRALGSGLKVASRAAVVGLGAATAAVIGLAKAFSTVEDAQAAFTPVLGSVERAQKLVQMLNETAATTPFQFGNLADAAKQLLPNMNNDLEKTLETVRMLGDTAGGSTDRFQRIVLGYNKAMLKGRVDMEALNIVAEAGVPVFKDLAEQVGVKMGPAFFKMVSAGRVTTQHLEKAFKKMTSDGGMFYKGMEIASKTQSGLFSTLKDNIVLTAATLGGVLAPTIKELLRGSTELAKSARSWVEANKELIESKFIEFVTQAKSLALKLWESIKKLNSEQNLFQRTTDAFGVIVDGLIFLGQHGKTIFKIIASVVALSVAFKALAVALGIVNFVMALNPLGIVILALAAVGTAVAAAVIYWDELKAAFLPLAGQIKSAWEPIGVFFEELWSGIVDKFNVAIFKIETAMNKIRSMTQAITSKVTGATDMLGITDPEERAAEEKRKNMPMPIVGSAAAANERYFTQRIVDNMELLIKDETGRAELKGSTKSGAIKMQRTGAFE